MYNLTTTAPISVFISLAALAGVSIHDTKLDKLATTFAGIPAMMSHAEGNSKSMASEPHTHVERVSLHSMQSSEPRVAPRIDHKKHLMQKNMPKGAHRFDGYSLPIA